MYKGDLRIKIKEARRRRGMSLRNLEKISGLSRSSISEFENGLTSPTIYELYILATSMDVKITDLFDCYNK